MLHMTQELSDALETMDAGELNELENWFGELEEIIRQAIQDTHIKADKERSTKCWKAVKGFRQYVFELQH